MSDDFVQSHFDLDCTFVSISIGTGPARLPNLLPLVLPSRVVHAPDFSKTVVPITELKLHDLGIEGWRIARIFRLPARLLPNVQVHIIIWPSKRLGR